MRLARDPSFWECFILAAGIGASMGLATSWPAITALAVVVVIEVVWRTLR